jgi:hypothetical protein
MSWPSPLRDPVLHFLTADTTVADELEAPTPVSGNQLLDVALSCTASSCRVVEIRLRVRAPNLDGVHKLGEREWRCPMCGTRTAIAWMQLAAVTERSEA